MMTFSCSISMLLVLFFFFFFQAEDGIRDYKVTGVQTCSLVVAITAVDGAPVSFASLLSVVPVVVSLAISNSAAFVAPRSRFPPSAPDSVGVVMVGLVASTTLPVPVVALPVGVPVIVGLESVGVDSVGLVEDRQSAV